MNDGDQDGRQRDDEITKKHRKVSDDVDSIMDEIDEVLEESAEEFARTYVEKGGQGLARAGPTSSPRNSMSALLLPASWEG